MKKYSKKSGLIIGLFFGAAILVESPPKCGEQNEVVAYAMSQQFVKDRLKAPATADFPSSDKIAIRTMGNCKYKVVAYVDAQNSFGALLRTAYSATMLYHPEKETWSASEIHILGQ